MEKSKLVVLIYLICHIKTAVTFFALVFVRTATWSFSKIQDDRRGSIKYDVSDIRVSRSEPASYFLSLQSDVSDPVCGTPRCRAIING
jgi:hypothetical protein